MSQFKHGRSIQTLILRSNASKSLGVLLAVALIAAHAHAQGCAQCLDSTQSTPPAVQAAYRHAIFLLVAAATTLFAATAIIIRRNR